MPQNITLLRLPSYNPELNAQENIWQYLRQNYLAGRIFEEYDDMVEACRKAWNAFGALKGQIKNIASRDWLCLSLRKHMDVFIARYNQTCMPFCLQKTPYPKKVWLRLSKTHDSVYRELAKL